MEGLRSSREAIQRMRNFLDDMANLPQAGAPGEVDDLEGLAARADSSFRGALDDDLNISAALGAVFGFIRDANRSASSRAGGEVGIRQLRNWNRVLGVFPKEKSQKEITPDSGAMSKGATGGASGKISSEEVERLLRDRESARQKKDFQTADDIRKYLREQGVSVKDGPAGPRWSYNN